MNHLLIAGLATLIASAHVHADSASCGELENHYGPYDYRVDKHQLAIVEKHHFTSNVELLRSGQEGSIGGDLDYTLHTYPNHSRALVAMTKLAERERTGKPAGAKYPVECYFDRAIRFRPKDGMVRMIYASFLSKQGKKEDAVKQLEIAHEAGISSPNIDYNMGLAYFDVGDFEKSLIFAHLAYQAGFNLPGLKGKLVKAGKWLEPPAKAAVEAGLTEPTAESRLEPVK